MRLIYTIPSMEPDNGNKRKKTLRFSFLDGIFASGMVGLTQDYFVPFLLLLGGTAREVGLLASIPNIIASLVQIKTSDIVNSLKSRKNTITFFVFLQALALLLVAIMAMYGIKSFAIFIILVILFTSFGAIGTPAWGSLMSDLIAREEWGRYFGWRNSILGTLIVITSFGAGFTLQTMKNYNLATGFAVLFFTAFIFRLISWYFLLRMHDPGIPGDVEDDFTISNFFKKMRSSNFIRFALFVSLLGFSVNLAAPYFTVLMIKDFKFSYILYSIVMITANLVMYLMMGRWGKLADTVGNIRVIKFTSPIIAIIPLLWLINQSPLFLIIAQVISGFAWAGFNLSATNFIFESVKPEKRVRYIAYFNTVNGLMLSAGALIGGFIIEYLPAVLGYRIFTLLIISSVLRIIVYAVISPGLKEVRHVSSVRSNQLFFSIIGIKPLIGVDRKTIQYLR